MIISKTPFRVSFFGGGTDYPEYFEKHGGAVLGTAVGHAAYIAVSQFHSQLFEHRMRIAYRKAECVNTVDEIQHPAFRECLRKCGIERDVEVSYMAELPSFSGLGSSSSCIVGTLNALHAFQGRRAVDPLELAYEAIALERGPMAECVGCQDQTFAAVGGFNVLEFRAQDDIVVHPVPISSERRLEFERNLLLLFTGFRRQASAIAARQVSRIDDNLAALKTMRAMVDKAYLSLTNGGSFSEFGTLLHESWVLKQTLDYGVANEEIAALYERGRAAGAFGGKLLGAGGGGFLLFVVPPDKRAAVREALPHLAEIPLTINAPGSQILHG